MKIDAYLEEAKPFSGIFDNAAVTIIDDTDDRRLSSSLSSLQFFIASPTVPIEDPE